MDDPYTTLGVKRDASQDDISRAYRKLAKKHHPDLNPGNTGAEARFKTISAANELLSNAEKRARYDRGEIDAAGQERPPQASYRDYAEGEPGRRYSPDGHASGGWNAQDLGDMFGSMFGDERRASGDRPVRGQDERYGFTTDFLDTVTGATRRLTLPDGRTLDVKLPPGTLDGQVLRLRGQGGSGWNGGGNGDALVEISVAPHAFFTRNGNDIRLELPVTLTEAVLGGPVEVPTPAGMVRMRIPGLRHTGTQLRLRGRGVPAHAGQDAGDLYAILRVVLGKPDAALGAFLADWKPQDAVNPRQAMGGASMIGIEHVMTLVSGLQRPELESWIVHRFVLPRSSDGGYVFEEIDIARIRLIKELRADLQVNEEALPIVLSLLDQLYELRRRMRELGDALGQTAPEDLRRAMVRHLSDRRDST